MYSRSSGNTRAGGSRFKRPWITIALAAAFALTLMAIPGVAGAMSRTPGPGVTVLNDAPITVSFFDYIGSNYEAMTCVLTVDGPSTTQTAQVTAPAGADCPEISLTLPAGTPPGSYTATTFRQSASIGSSQYAQWSFNVVVPGTPPTDTTPPVMHGIPSPRQPRAPCISSGCLRATTSGWSATACT
jgi:hypothetical protein